MSRWLIFPMTLLLLCGTSSAGLRDVLDAADDAVRRLEQFSLIPVNAIYRVLGTRKVQPIIVPRKRVTADSNDESDLITIIRSPQSTMEMSQLKYLDGNKMQTPLGEGVDLASKVVGRVTNRLGGLGEKLAEGALSTLGSGGADPGALISKVASGLTGGLSDQVSNSMTGVGEMLINRADAARNRIGQVGGMVAERLGLANALTAAQQSPSQQNVAQGQPVPDTAAQAGNVEPSAESNPNPQSQVNPNPQPITSQPKTGQPTQQYAQSPPKAPPQQNSPLGNLISSLPLPRVGGFLG